jgi:hypothetical protein
MDAVLKRVSHFLQAVNEGPYESMRKNYPELKLPHYRALDDALIGFVRGHTPDEVFAERAAYLLSRDSPAKYDEWEIDVPF